MHLHREESVKHCGMGTDIVSWKAASHPIDAESSDMEYHFNSFLNLQFLGLQYAVGYPSRTTRKPWRPNEYFKSLRVPWAD